LFGLPFAWLEKPFNKLFCDAAIQVNTFQWKWLMKQHGLPRKKIVFVPDGIPEDRFRKVDNKEFLKKWGLEGKFVICNLGRVQKYKGLDHVVKVLPNLVKKHPNVVFLSMGKDAGDTERLKKMAYDLGVSEHVIFTGMVTEDEKLMGLDAADVFVLPSEWEAFGIVTLEAYARKTAAICTRMEGGEFLIDEGKNGFLFDFGDLEMFEKQLLTLIEDDKLRHRMEQTNYEKSKKLTNEYIAKHELQDLYYRLTKLPRKRVSA
jgi:glycosyltransferase involved in cell wall biosynthesis